MIKSYFDKYAVWSFNKFMVLMLTFVKMKNHHSYEQH